MKEKLGVMDSHVHLENVKISDHEVAEYFGIALGSARWEAEPMSKVAEYIAKDNIEQVVAIYEDPGLIEALRLLSPSCDILGFYFVRDIASFDKETIKGLYGRGVLQGLKVHPVNDNFELTSDNLRGVLDVAGQYGLPILYHSDDRADFWQLTHPDLQRALVRENPDVTFIIGHGGAYANPRLVGNSPQVIGYWEGSEKGPSRRYLVESALRLAYDYDNVFFDTSVAYNRIKAEIIVASVENYEGLELKILPGSDYPIKHASVQGQLKSLVNAGMRENLIERIAKNRLIAG